jgi:hypothetical protein
MRSYFQLFTVSFLLKEKKKDAVTIWAMVVVQIRIFSLSIRIFQTKNTEPRCTKKGKNCSKSNT